MQTAAEGRADWGGGTPHTPSQLTLKPQGKRGCGDNYMGWNLASPLGWNGTAAPVPALSARLEEFTHHLQQTCEASGAAVIGPPEPTIKETGLCLLIKLEPQGTRRLSILTPHLKKKWGNRARCSEVTYTRSCSPEVEHLGFDFRNFRSYLPGTLLSPKSNRPVCDFHHLPLHDILQILNWG